MLWPLLKENEDSETRKKTNNEDKMIFFLKRLILGFSIAAPVGPIGILCIRRTLQFGRLSGFFSGLGAAAADCIYGIIAAFGLTFVSNLSNC